MAYHVAVISADRGSDRPVQEPFLMREHCAVISSLRQKWPDFTPEEAD